MGYTTIVDTLTVFNHLGDPDWRIIDCRFDLNDTESGREAYRESHLPRALYAHLDEDLSGQLTPESGRHPLPDIKELADTFSRWGITPATQVICYDTQKNSIAARLWFLLRWMGHEHVAVIDGGLHKWLREERITSKETSPVQRFEFTPGKPISSIVETEQLLEHIDDHNCLIDVRIEERFSGENETIDPVAGHIPGAINLPLEKNLDASGCFMPAEALQVMYQRILANNPARNCAVMCGSGVTACHTLIALELAGLSGAKLYAGSWSEWIRDPNRPIEIGTENLS